MQILGKQKESDVKVYSHSIVRRVANLKNLLHEPVVIGSDGINRCLVAGHWNWNSKSGTELA